MPWPTSLLKQDREWIMNNAEDLFQALSEYSKEERELIGSSKFDRVAVRKNKSRVKCDAFELEFRHSTLAQRKVEAGRP